jgi:hypothetical protein
MRSTLCHCRTCHATWITLLPYPDGDTLVGRAEKQEISHDVLDDADLIYGCLVPEHRESTLIAGTTRIGAGTILWSQV